MSFITAEVIGKDEVMERMQKRKQTLVARIKAVMLLQMEKLARYVRTDKLSGQVLKNRTGTLRRSIHADVEAETDAVTGIVGTNVSYGKIHELGGTFQIPASYRNQTQAWGRPIVPRMVFVRAHSATYPQRAFLRPSLDEKRESILAALRTEVGAVMNEP